MVSRMPYRSSDRVKADAAARRSAAGAIGRLANSTSACWLRAVPRLANTAAARGLNSRARPAPRAPGPRRGPDRRASAAPAAQLVEPLEGQAGKSQAVGRPDGVRPGQGQHPLHLPLGRRLSCGR